MGIKLIIILLLELTLAIIGHGGVLEKDSHSGHKSLKVSRHINGLQSSNKVKKSIQSEDGDIIDCIDIYKQPAFDHPALKNHKIQMRPSQVPTRDITSETLNNGNNKQNKGNITNIAVTTMTQQWHKSGSCPKGTVPIRRIQKKRSPYEARKHPGFFPSTKQFNKSNGSENFIQSNHSLTVLITEGYAYIGAKGDIAIFNPPVELDDEYTTSQVALKTGPHDNFEAIEAGTAVNPRVYHDRDTRFFVHWTADGSKKTGCFDHFCPGFVQVSQDIALGAVIRSSSTPNALPDAVAIVYIYKDTNTNNWWVNYGENQNIGYWPGKLFKALSHHAETVQWGGDVYSTKVRVHPHTATGMGSGDYPFPGGSGGVIRRIRILDNSLVLKFPEWTNRYSDEYDCYDYIYYTDVQDPEFYYGGPGRNWKCP